MEENLTNGDIFNRLSENKSLVKYFEDNSIINLRDFILKVRFSSPHLARSLDREVEWVFSNFKTSFDVMLDDLIDESKKLLHFNDLEVVSNKLRAIKRRVALIIACADICKIWSLGKVTLKLTQFADSSLSTVFDAVVQNFSMKKKKREFTEVFGSYADIKSSDLGFVVIAMGKMGAFELNYSSDIDFNVFYDSNIFSKDQLLIFQPILIKITRDVIKVMSEINEEGYIFRCDLRLRPEPSVNPVCMPVKFALEYYKEKGRTWERSAYIKARAVAGDISKGNCFLADLEPFIWRKKLNYFAIQDTQEIRKKIARKEGKGQEVGVLGFNVKVGSGGIRDIELYTQTLQLIYGGRDKNVRCLGTCQSLQVLKEEGRITESTLRELSQAYEFYRNLEHRIQMLNDSQTHEIPKTEEGITAIAVLMMISVDELEHAIRYYQNKVIGICDEFFSVFSEDKNISDEVLFFPKNSFKKLESIHDLGEKWNKYNAFKSQRSKFLFSKIEKSLFEMISNTYSPAETLANIDKYFSQLSSGVEIFSLLNSNRNFLNIFVDIASKVPQVLEEMGQNTDILASVVNKDFFHSFPTLEGIVFELDRILNVKSFDYEDKLSLIRQFVKELKFKVAVHLIQRKSNIEEASFSYSIIAEAVLQILAPIVTENFSKRYGPLKSKGFAIIGMGKLGSREMTLTSDLDLIIVYDPVSLENLEKSSKIHPSTYFSKLTKELVSALTSTMKDGYLYKVDMRLRPSGSKGPVAVSFSSFSNYQRTEAWTWEHLALIRGRVVYGEKSFSSRIEGVIKESLRAPRDVSKVFLDVKDMRGKLFDNLKLENKKIKSLNIKVGQGMMLDLELLIKMGALITKQENGKNISYLIDKLEGIKYFSSEEVDLMRKAWRIFYTSDFLSRYFNFDISKSTDFESYRWSELFQKDSFFIFLKDFLSEDLTKDNLKKHLESSVGLLSNEINSVFNSKLLG